MFFLITQHTLLHASHDTVSRTSITRFHKILLLESSVPSRLLRVQRFHINLERNPRFFKHFLEFAAHYAVGAIDRYPVTLIPRFIVRAQLLSSHETLSFFMNLGE